MPQHFLKTWLRRQSSFIAALLTFASFREAAAADDPVYHGDKFSRVLELRSPETIATAALESGIDKTLPILVRALNGRDTVFAQAEQELWKRLPSDVKARHRTQMPVPARSTELKALMALSEIGIEARAAVPALIAHLSAQTNRGDRIMCLSVLAAIGTDSTEAVTELTKATQDADASVRESAAIGLAFIGPKAAPAVPVLAEQLRTGRIVSPFVFLALGRIGPAASNALPVLREAFRNPSNAVSVPQALQALHNIGPAASSAIPELANVVQKRAPDYPLAVEALMNIGPPARECLPLLESMLTETNAVTRVLAAAAVLKIGGPSEKALQVLVRGLEGADHSRASWSPPFYCVRGFSVGFDAQLTAAWLLGDCGKPAAAALPALARAMHGRSVWLPVVAARALWRIEGQSDEALPVLIEALRGRGSSETEGALAAMTLAEMGPRAKAALPLLEKARLDGNQTLRREATLALERIR